MHEQLINRISLVTPPAGVKSAILSTSKPVAATPDSFASVLAKVQQEGPTLRFSSHAEVRMQQRGVALTQADIVKLQQAVDKAGQKGSKDVYVVYGQTGFVVNVPNRTVITAMSNQDQPVVTNIDSVVVVSGPDH